MSTWSASSSRTISGHQRSSWLTGQRRLAVQAARAGGRAIPELWPLGTEALALAVSVLEAKRLQHRAILRLSWVLLVASVALSTLLQVAVAAPTLVGYLTAGATPVWLLAALPCSVCFTALTPAPTGSDPAPRY
jgi:hypothetical protein